MTSVGTASDGVAETAVRRSRLGERPLRRAPTRYHVLSLSATQDLNYEHAATLIGRTWLARVPQVRSASPAGRLKQSASRPLKFELRQPCERARPLAEGGRQSLDTRPPSLLPLHPLTITLSLPFDRPPDPTQTSSHPTAQHGPQVWCVVLWPLEHARRPKSSQSEVCGASRRVQGPDAKTRTRWKGLRPTVVRPRVGWASGGTACERAIQRDPLQGWMARREAGR